MEKKNIEVKHLSESPSKEAPLGQYWPSQMSDQGSTKGGLSSEDLTYDLYTVKKGDSVAKIAYIFDMRISEITRINNVLNESIYPGQVLKVNKKEGSEGAQDTAQSQVSSLKTNANSHYVLEELKQTLQKPSSDTDPSSLAQSSYIDNNLNLSSDLRDAANEKGEISNIEHIYRRVFGKALYHPKQLFAEEFSNFSKNFESKAPKQKTDLQDFLSMFDQVKEDPAKLDQQIEDEETIVVGDYLKYDKESVLKTEALYCTRYGQTKGVLSLRDKYMQFDPVQCPENESIAKCLNQYQAFIDYQDISESNILRLINEAAMEIDNNFIKKAYKFDFFLQIDLTAVNGLTLHVPPTLDQTPSSPQRNTVIIANLFIRFQHKDMDGMVLTNKNQKKIVKAINDKVMENMAKASKTDFSCTFVPYYDSVLDENQKRNLCEIKMSPLIKDKVKNQSLNNYFKSSTQTQCVNLIQYRPTKSDPSEILNDFKISNIVQQLPHLIKTNEWELLYSLNRDGCSVGTFFERAKKYRITLLVIHDSNGWVFGGYCNETWHPATSFYGTGENFLFTFKNEDKPKIYTWTGLDDQFQWASEKAIGLGGGTLGRFGIYLGNDFYKGSSSKTSTFDNEVLSSEVDFICTNLELWGLD